MLDHSQNLRIAPGHLLCLEDARGLRISVQHGLGILTQEGDGEDSTLMPGVELTLRHGGKAIFVARSDTRLQLALPRGMRSRVRAQIKAYLGARPVVLRSLRFKRPQGFLAALISATLARISYERSRAA